MEGKPMRKLRSKTLKLRWGRMSKTEEKKKLGETLTLPPF